ncbi:hypothetical protein RI367_008814 [Sorochytrium milnesiophthora]
MASASKGRASKASASKSTSAKKGTKSRPAKVPETAVTASEENVQAVSTSDQPAERQADDSTTSTTAAAVLPAAGATPTESRLTVTADRTEAFDKALRQVEEDKRDAVLAVALGKDVTMEVVTKLFDLDKLKKPVFGDEVTTTNDSTGSVLGSITTDLLEHANTATFEASIDYNQLSPEHRQRAFVRNMVAWSLCLASQPWTRVKDSAGNVVKMTQQEFATSRGIGPMMFSRLKKGAHTMAQLHFGMNMPFDKQPRSERAAHSLHLMAGYLQRNPAVVYRAMDCNDTIVQRFLQQRELALDKVRKWEREHMADQKELWGPDSNAGAKPVDNADGQQDTVNNDDGESDDENEPDPAGSLLKVVYTDRSGRTHIIGKDSGDVMVLGGDNEFMTEATTKEAVQPEKETEQATTATDKEKEGGAEVREEMVAGDRRRKEIRANLQRVAREALEERRRARRGRRSRSVQHASDAESAGSSREDDDPIVVDDTTPPQSKPSRKRAQSPSEQAYTTPSKRSRTAESPTSRSSRTRDGTALLSGRRPTAPVTALSVARANREIQQGFLDHNSPADGEQDIENMLDAASDSPPDNVVGQRQQRAARLLAEIEFFNKHPGPRREGLPPGCSDTRDVALEENSWYWCPARSTWDILLYIAEQRKRQLVHIGAHSLRYYHHPAEVIDNSRYLNLGDPDGKQLLARQFFPFVLDIPEQSLAPLLFVNALWGAPNSAPSIMMAEVAVRRAIATVKAYPAVEVILLLPNRLSTQWNEELSLACAEYVQFHDLLEFQPPPGAPTFIGANNVVELMWEPPFLQHDCPMQFVSIGVAGTNTFDLVGKRRYDRRVYDKPKDTQQAKRALDAAIVHGIHEANKDVDDDELYKCPWVWDAAVGRLKPPVNLSLLKYDEDEYKTIPALQLAPEEIAMLERPFVSRSRFEKEGSQRDAETDWVEAALLPDSERSPVIIELDENGAPKKVSFVIVEGSARKKPVTDAIIIENEVDGNSSAASAPSQGSEGVIEETQPANDEMVAEPAATTNGATNGQPVAASEQVVPVTDQEHRSASDQALAVQPADSLVPSAEPVNKDEEVSDGQEEQDQASSDQDATDESDTSLSSVEEDDTPMPDATQSQENGNDQDTVADSTAQDSTPSAALTDVSPLSSISTQASITGQC